MSLRVEEEFLPQVGDFKYFGILFTNLPLKYRMSLVILKRLEVELLLMGAEVEDDKSKGL